MRRGRECRAGGGGLPWRARRQLRENPAQRRLEGGDRVQCDRGVARRSIGDKQGRFDVGAHLAVDVAGQADVEPRRDDPGQPPPEGRLALGARRARQDRHQPATGRQSLAAEITWRNVMVVSDPRDALDENGGFIRTTFAMWRLASRSSMCSASCV